MISDDRIVTFLNLYQPAKSRDLAALEKEARGEGIPIIRGETQGLLAALLAMRRPASILEIGTAIGFSALYMAEQAVAPVHITTIENYQKRIPVARANFAAFEREDEISLLAGDAAALLPGLKGPFDMIFMDAAKGQYLAFLPEAVRLLAPGGVLVADNVLQDGDLLESRFAVVRRDRTIHKRMRGFLQALRDADELVTTLLSVGDGVTISVKK